MVARATTGSDNSAGASLLQLVPHGPDGVVVGEGQHLPRNLLPALVTLAENGDHVVRSGGAQGRGDGVASTTAVQHGDRPVGPVQLGPCAHASTCARMAAGSSVRGLSSVTTTSSAPAAAAAPIGSRFSGSRSPPQPSTTTRRCPARRGQHGGDRLRGVGEVDEHRRRARTELDPLHPARHDRIGESGRGPIQVHPGEVGHRERGDGVADVELAGQAERHLPRSVRRGHRDRGPSLAHRSPIGSGVVTWTVQADRPDRRQPLRQSLVDQLRTPWVVDVDHRSPGAPGGEQGRLGREVGRDVAVEVQVIGTEVGEGGDLEDESVHPAQGEGVGRHLHHDRVGAPFGHHGEQGVELGRLRRGDRGASTLQTTIVELVADGADQTDVLAGGPKHRLQQVGRRGLAVGAGDAVQPQASAGMVVDPVGQGGDQLARAGYDHDGHGARDRSGGHCSGLAGRVGEDRASAAGDSVGGEVGAVHSRPRSSHIQVAFLHQPGVGCHAEDSEVGRPRGPPALRRRQADRGEQIGPADAGPTASVAGSACHSTQDGPRPDATESGPRRLSVRRDRGRVRPAIGRRAPVTTRPSWASGPTSWSVRRSSAAARTA